MIDVLIVHTGGNATRSRIQGEDLRDMAEAMGHNVRYLEPLYTPGLCYWLDEEGKYNGHAHNDMAEALYRNNGGDLLPGDFIVGPVCITGLKGFDSGTVPDTLIDQALAMGISISDERS